MSDVSPEKLEASMNFVFMSLASDERHFADRIQVSWFQTPLHEFIVRQCQSLILYQQFADPCCRLKPLCQSSAFLKSIMFVLRQAERGYCPASIQISGSL
jgi:hypothetical protein